MFVRKKLVGNRQTLEQILSIGVKALAGALSSISFLGAESPLRAQRSAPRAILVSVKVQIVEIIKESVARVKTPELCPTSEALCCIFVSTCGESEWGV